MARKQKTPKKVVYVVFDEYGYSDVNNKKPRLSKYEREDGVRVLTYVLKKEAK